MKIRVMIPGQALSPNVDVVVDALGRDHTIEPLPVPAPGPRNSDGSAQNLSLDRFKHTPAPLLVAWYAAQHVLAETEPGDVVAVPDRGGIGGILALAEGSKPPGDRRRIWTIAGDGAWLEATLIAGTAAYAEMPLASEIDWELVQYRSSDEVLTASPLAVEYLKRIDVAASVVGGATNLPAGVARRGGTGVWIPGPVSRRNRSGDVLRAVASIADVAATVSDQDSADLIWSGSSWQALSGIRSILGPRLQRADRPSKRPAFVVVGDAFEPPDDATRAWREAGVPVLAVRGSVTAALWADCQTWDSSDELAALLEGRSSPPQEASSPQTGAVRVRSVDDTRARRVSVGVPVFRNVAYLDECIESILGQSETPHELLLMDDGSDSADVDEALNRWAARAPARVRTFKQANRGVCVARNRMIDEMTGDSFLLVDQDDVLEPEFIRRTAQTLRHDDSLWAVATWTEFFGSYEGIEAKPPFDRRVGLRENPIVSTAVLVDMRARSAGLTFAPDLAFIYCEDWHYWSQIISAGGRIGLVPEPLVRHRVHEASGGFQRTELGHDIGRTRAAEVLLGRPTD